MTKDQRNTEQPEPAHEVSSQRLDDNRWHVFLRVYARLNRLSHHALSGLVKLLIVVYLLLCVVLLLLRYVFLPHIDNYKTDIEKMIGSSLERSVSISRVAASWDGLRPHLELKQVTLRDQQGQNVLVLPAVNVTVSWTSLLVADVRLHDLEIDQPQLDLQRTVDGKIYIAGWWLDPNKKHDSRGLDWLLSQKNIVIKNGTLRWTDQKRAAATVALTNVNFIMRNRWQTHKASLTATPPANLAGPIDIRADFKHHLFSENISDFLEWEGQMYADLNKTDLAAWKSYFDYPVEIDQGMGAVRAWFSFDEGKIVDFTADLKLSNVTTLLAPDLQPLDLQYVAGRLSVQEISNTKSIYGINVPFAERVRGAGHQIGLTNFTFETRSGMRLPPTTLTERYIPASADSPEQLLLTTKFLDLNILANLIEHFPIPKAYGAQLRSLEPAGQISDFSLSLQGKFPEITHYKIDGRFTDLAMMPLAAKPVQKDSLALPPIFLKLPGFSNLTGQIDADEKKGSIQLASTNLLLQVGGYLAEPEMGFDSLVLRANWSVGRDNQWTINLPKFEFVQQGLKANFFGNYSSPVKKASRGELDLTGTISHIDLPKVGRYLPLATDPDLNNWLTKGLLQGSLEDVNLRVKGDLADFPFIKDGLLDKNIFKVTGKIVDGKINYLPGVFGVDGVSPYWPLLSKIQGKIEFNRQAMDVFADSGVTAEIPVTKVHARIPDLLNTNPLLQIEGSAKSPSQDFIHYIATSPVLGWIDNFTQDTQMSGGAKLELRLDLPLFHPREAKVVGSVDLNGNEIVLLKGMPELTGVNGQLDFNERGLSLNTLKGSFLGSRITVVGGTQKDGVIRVKAEGQVTAEGVRKAYPQQEFRHLLSRISGRTPYSAIIQVKNKQTNVWVDSTLQGMGLRLPSPLTKNAQDNLALHFELITASPETDQMKITLGRGVNVYYQRQKDVETNSWKVQRGGIGVNAPAPTPDSGVLAFLELPSLNADELQALLPDSRGSDKNVVDTEFNLSQYLEPSLVSAHVTELTLFGKKLDEVVLGASRLNESWQANIDSKQISGYLTWDNAEHGLGRVTARLGSLIIPETAANDVVDLLQNTSANSNIPGLDLVADNVELFGKKLGRLDLQAKNVSRAVGSNINEWQIDKMMLSNPDAELTAQGKWINDTSVTTVNKLTNKSVRNKSAKSQTEMKFQLNLTNAGKLLDRFGYANLISGGKGKMTGEITWAGPPYSMDMPSLSGGIHLDLQSGQFLKVDPGAAKLLSVLNMQALPRRLMLDFRDVFSNGFSFDGINGDAQIAKGVAKTDNLKMRSVAATVVLSGLASITDETQNLHVVVVPEVNAGAASVVYGLAVNPVIGLGTFLAQLFLRQPLMKAFTFEYQITGSWKEPSVVKLK